jgi:hypothetical protein
MRTLVVFKNHPRTKPKMPFVVFNITVVVISIVVEADSVR